jgi:hypothetical protein
MNRRIFAVLAALATMLTLMIASPGGAVADDAVAGQRNVLRAALSGTREVPAADRDGTGQTTVTLRGNQACFVVSWARIGAPFAAHIHRGVAGTNGPVVVPFFMTPGNMPLPASLSMVAGCVNANPRVLADIRANPSRYYINVHNRQFPEGVIRGQLQLQPR